MERGQGLVLLLVASSRRLAAARTLRFTAVVSYENPSRLGPPLVYTTRSEVTVQRPHTLRVVTPGLGVLLRRQDHDGVVARREPRRGGPAPPTIDAALETAFHSAAIYFPFSDLIVADPCKDIAECKGPRARRPAGSGIAARPRPDALAIER